MSAIALAQFLAQKAAKHSQKVADNTFVVGGAVRNFLLGHPIKDIDVVIDSVRAGMDSDAFAKFLSREIPTSTTLVTNNYGVAILTISGSGWVLDGENMKGEVIEIANARRESYGGAAGKGYKPHMVEPTTIEEDLIRREFTFNTLLWRMSDIVDGVEDAGIIDLLHGIKALNQGVIMTPGDPNKTFQDDPTRIVRAFKFKARFGFELAPAVATAISENAHLIHNMPWEAVATIFVDNVLRHPNGGALLPLMDSMGVLSELVKLMEGKEASSFWAKQARSFPVHLQLDLLDRGFTMKPLGFLTEDQVGKLRDLVAEQGEGFVEILRKPPVDNMAHIQEFNLQGADRSLPVKLARELLVDNPSILPGLNEAIRGRLSS